MYTFYQDSFDKHLTIQKTGDIDSLSRILDDTYALFSACKQPLSALLSLMDVYKQELNYSVLSCIIDANIFILDSYLLSNLSIIIQSRSCSMFHGYFILQIAYKVSSVVSDAIPQSAAEFKRFTINLLQFAAE